MSELFNFHSLDFKKERKVLDCMKGQNNGKKASSSPLWNGLCEKWMLSEPYVSFMLIGGMW